MSELAIVANTKAKPDKIDFVKAELEKLVETTRIEEGCLQYDLHLNNANPVHFVFFENWESRELWQVHMGSRHLQDYLAATEGAIEGFYVNELTKIA